ncbi:pyruvate formate lyase activating enzyme [Butyrivibrio hungatei DSM 14810]|uniref:Pyruvate formate-lyase-activating enzyme n=1 Tax=Butyrivibrio hungatei DSM 14810 TaxID=1121132 RepID=A0A1M7T4Q9_9FIRM|nr:pyruvate formate-lyase-activating protein [Butyrivibrio hungatei]SHN65671.1 pyruvate formate lyase activating enzyme [Butyrivibrio hungatei DSM 14810]
MIKGAIHSIETFGSVDGPGIRFIVFLKGCNLRCKYCHNVDTWDPHSEDMRTADEILDFAERYRSYWGEEGGITVSGGEPLLQIDFLIDLFKKAKERGINTCIDTAVQPFTKEEPFFSKFEELMKYTDLLLVDIKHIDREEHIKLTGLPNDNIKECFEYLDQIGKPIWIRHVLVPGITDNDEYLRETRKFIEKFSNIKRIDVLPYHSMGQMKFKELGIPYQLEGVESPTTERVENARAILNGKKN